MPRAQHILPVRFEHLGQQRTMKQLAGDTGIAIMTLYQRWHRGDRGEKLTRDVLPRRRAVSASSAQEPK